MDPEQQSESSPNSNTFIFAYSPGSRNATGTAAQANRTGRFISVPLARVALRQHATRMWRFLVAPPPTSELVGVGTTQRANHESSFNRKKKARTHPYNHHPLALLLSSSLHPTFRRLVGAMIDLAPEIVATTYIRSSGCTPC